MDDQDGSNMYVGRAMAHGEMGNAICDAGYNRWWGWGWDGRIALRFIFIRTLLLDRWSGMGLLLTSLVVEIF